jgi:hypothetical protein
VDDGRPLWDDNFIEDALIVDDPNVPQDDIPPDLGNPGPALNAAIERPDEADDSPPPPPRTGPPKVDEWQHFFSKVIIGTLTDFYVSAAFRGIDEDTLSEREAKSLVMTKNERDAISRPLAEFANKTPYLRKRGRLIVSSADSVESLVTLGMWFSRVNRIARKYRPTRAQRPRTVRSNTDVSSGQGSPNPASNGNESGTRDWAEFHVFNPGSG